MFSAILLFISMIISSLLVISMLKKNFLYGIYLAALCLYLFPALIGYRFFPSLSIQAKIYFKSEDWWSFLGFGFFSLFGVWIILYNNTFNNYTFNPCIKIKKANYGLLLKIIGYLFVFFIILFQIYDFKINWNNINWENVSNADYVSKNLLLQIHSILYKCSVGFCIIFLFLSIKNKNSKNYFYKNLLYITTALMFSITFLYSSKSGTRQDIIFLMLGIIYLMYSLHLLNRKTIIGFIFFIAMILSFLISVEKTRYGHSYELNYNFVERLLRADYYYPAHMMFTAISLNIISPLEVIKSNLCNSLILLGYPYLQMGLTDMVIPGIATRSTGFAFFPFTEGYMFMGWFGIFYNSIVLGFWMKFWYKLGSSNDNDFNTITLSIMASLCIGLVRGQTSYFIKYYYTNILINLIIYMLLDGKSISIFHRK